MKQSRLFLFVFLVSTFLIASSSDSEGQITGLGFLPGESSSGASGVSNDGTVVTGFGETNSFTWTANDGFVEIASPDFNMTSVVGLSGDGNVVAGTGDVNTSDSEGFIWTAEEGFTSLGGIPGGSSSVTRANAISNDGTTVVGWGSGDQGGQTAFRWTAGTGIESLGFAGQAWGVSGDGSTVVGNINIVEPSGAQRLQAFRWTQDNGLADLPGLPSESESFALSVSSDGSTIVGGARNLDGTIGFDAFRWTSDEGVVSLGSLLQGEFFDSAADVVSADGSVVAGRSNSEDGQIAFVWTEESGIVSLFDQLELQGEDLSEWQLLTSVGAISDDGQFVVGTGINASGDGEAFLARLDFSAVPEPSASIVLFAIFSISLTRRSRNEPSFRSARLVREPSNTPSVV